MKELLIKQKAKRYDEAIERAREYKKYGYMMINVALDNIFPELNESEDERIRKVIIYGMYALKNQHNTRFASIPIDDVIAWLEKQGEHKPDTQHSTEWSVYDFRTWQYIVSDVLTKKAGIGQYLDSGECKKIAKYMQEEWGEKLGKEQTQEELRKGEDFGIDGLYAAIDILKKTLGKVDGYQTDDGILEHKCAISAVKSLYEQNPAWSEEDKEILDDIILCGEHHCYLDARAVCWLKSLKDRYIWKPSDEQMEALKDALDDAIWKYDFNGSLIKEEVTRKHAETIESLYNDLKKLRKE